MNKGKLILLSVFTAFVAIDVALLAVYGIRGDTQRLVATVIRLSLLLVNLLLIYRGYIWALWLFLVLIGGYSIVSMVLAFSRGPLFAIAAICGFVCMYLLAWPRSVREFLRAQRIKTRG